MSAYKMSRKLKTWQFSFRGYSGVAKSRPDWNSSILTWESTEARHHWHTKRAQRSHAVNLPGASGAMGPPKP